MFTLSPNHLNIQGEGQVRPLLFRTARKPIEEQIYTRFQWLNASRYDMNPREVVLKSANELLLNEEYR